MNSIDQFSATDSRPLTERSASFALPGWVKLGLSLVSFALSLLLLELGVRLVAPQDLDFFNWQKIKRASSRPGQPYEYIPNSYNGSYIGVPVSINSLGLRDHEIQIPKPPDTVRILAVGDSVAFGYGVPIEETFGKILEAKLNQRAAGQPRYEVINAGVEGTDIGYYYHFLRSSAPVLEPDVVIVAISLNDLREYAGTERIRSGPSARIKVIRGINALLLFHSHLYLSSYLNLKSVMYRTGLRDANTIEGFNFLALGPASDKQDRAWSSTLQLLGKLAALAREHRYPLLLVVFPMEIQLSPVALELYQRELRLRIGPEALTGDPQRRLREFGLAQKVPVVDLLPVFQSATHHGLFLRNRAIKHDPAHPSPLGHRLAGEELYRVLMTSGLLQLKLGDRRLAVTRG